MEMRNPLLKLCAALATFTFTESVHVWAQEAPPHFDVNDVVFLFPTPTTPDQVRELISGDDALDGGSTIWPKEFFDQVIKFAKNDPAAAVGSSKIKFPAELENSHNWKVAGPCQSRLARGQ